MALCAFPSFRYFVNIWRLLSIIWHLYELLASSFTVSATTLECGSSFPSLRPFTADWTKLLKHFNGVYRTNRCSWVHSSLRSKYKFKIGVIIVSLITWKLDISIFRGWVNSLLSSAYFFMDSSLSDRETSAFLKIGGNASKFYLKLSGTRI